MPGTHSQGTGIGAGERWTKANYGHSCYVAHPKERQSVHNNAVYFEVEILHCLNVQACPELVKAEEKQGISTWTNFTDDCLSCQQKRLPNLEEWKWRRVREVSLPEKTESHHHSCEKWIMSFLSNLQIFWETCRWGYNRDDCPFWRLSIFWREQCTSIGGSNEKLKWKLKVCETAFVGCVHLFMWDQHSQPSWKRKCQIWLQKC